MKALVTGAAGFIGSSLTDRLLTEGWDVVGVDNFSTGRREFLTGALKNPKFRLLERDLFDPKALAGALDASVDQVFHLAANADVRFGLDHPRRDLEQNVIVTWNILEAMRGSGVKGIAFSSTGSVYGEAPQIPTPETCPFPIQTSLYGASKTAAEGLISAYCEGYGMKGHIFRFVSIMGERYTHGHVIDFVAALKKDPTRLRVLFVCGRLPQCDFFCTQSADAKIGGNLQPRHGRIHRRQPVDRNHWSDAWLQTYA